MHSRIIVIGTSNTDMIVEVPRLPNPGQTVVGGSFRILPGGKGANQAVAAVRLGADTRIVTAVGDDEFGANTIANLEREGINTSCVVVKSGIHSGVALIYVDIDGENMIAVSPGANGLLSPEDVLHAEELICSALVMILQLEMPIETAIAAAKAGRECGCVVLLNPAPISEDGVPDELLANIDIITPNIGELMALYGRQGSIDDAAEWLLSKGPHTVVVTMGKDGAKAFTTGGSFHVPAIDVKAVDTVGAGDCFTAALAVSLSSGGSLDEAVQFAVVASGLSTLERGAQEGMPHLEAVLSYIRSHL